MSVWFELYWSMSVWSVNVGVIRDDVNSRCRCDSSYTRGKIRTWSLFRSPQATPSSRPTSVHRKGSKTSPFAASPGNQERAGCTFWRMKRSRSCAPSWPAGLPRQSRRRSQTWCWRWSARPPSIRIYFFSRSGLVLFRIKSNTGILFWMAYSIAAHVAITLGYWFLYSLSLPAI